MAPDPPPGRWGAGMAGSNFKFLWFTHPTPLSLSRLRGPPPSGTPVSGRSCASRGFPPESWTRRASTFRRARPRSDAGKVPSPGLVLISVVNQNREFRFAAPPRSLLRRPTAMISAGPASSVFCDQRDLAVVVDEADPRQPLVRGALAQLHRVEVAQVDAALGERLVELRPSAARLRGGSAGS